jgi:hypothetical protein
MGGIAVDNQNLNFKYKFPKDFNPVYSNGVYGGIAPQGELVVNFYFERPPLPYEETLKLDENYNASEHTTVPENHNLNIVRYVSSGVVLNLDTAKSFHEWLGNKIEILEKAEKEEGS